MRSGYTVILVPGADGRVSAAMPGCFSMGDTREQALTRIADAMATWSEVEAEDGRAPLRETPGVIASAVSKALEILDDMRRAGEVPDDAEYCPRLVQAECVHNA